MASHVDACDYDRMSDASWWAASPSSAWHPAGGGAPAPAGVGARGAYGLALERDPLAARQPGRLLCAIRKTGPRARASPQTGG